MTDFDKKLDEIAANAVLPSATSIFQERVNAVRAAMLAAIELFAQREPSESAIVLGIQTIKNGYASKRHGVIAIFRAMQAAQLKETPHDRP